MQRTHAALRELARQATAQEADALVFITFANEAFLPLLSNWVAHARHAGVHAFVVGAMDAGVRRFCRQQGLLSWPMDDAGLLDLVAATSNETLTRLGDANVRRVPACFACCDLPRADVTTSCGQRQRRRVSQYGREEGGICARTAAGMPCCVCWCGPAAREHRRCPRRWASMSACWTQTR